MENLMELMRRQVRTKEEHLQEDKDELTRLRIKVDYNQLAIEQKRLKIRRLELDIEAFAQIREENVRAYNILDKHIKELEKAEDDIEHIDVASDVHQ